MPIALQIPIGLETDADGVVDLVSMKALYFDGDNGEIIRTEEIPEIFWNRQKSKEKNLLKRHHSFLMN